VNTVRTGNGMFAAFLTQDSLQAQPFNYAADEIRTKILDLSSGKDEVAGAELVHVAACFVLLADGAKQGCQSV
jgi:hypothetical protein